MVRTLVMLMMAGATTSCWRPRNAPEPANLRVTQRYLVPLCLDGRAVGDDERQWQVDSGEHVLAFTMHSDPRWPGAGEDKGPPGRAVIRFLAQRGHRYEVETRTDDPLTYSRRVWTEREWKPVVRDRGDDVLVSGEPSWVAAGANACT